MQYWFHHLLMTRHCLCTQVIDDVFEYVGDDPDHGDPMMGNGDARPNGDVPDVKFGLNEDGDDRQSLAKSVQDINVDVA